jgi:hypothetical protein
VQIFCIKNVKKKYALVLEYLDFVLKKIAIQESQGCFGRKNLGKIQ